MTPEQIKALAREYAESHAPAIKNDKLRADAITLNAEGVFEPFLRGLNSRYCIVEREKVMEKYKREMPFYEESDDSQIVVDTLESIFGEEMFNQNEA